MDNIADLLNNMSEAEFQNLRQTAENLFHGMSSEEDEPQSKAENGGISPELLAKIGRIMQSMQSSQDGRSDLIAALKPYLSAPRQKKADEAMQMLRMMDILPMLQSGLF